MNFRAQEYSKNTQKPRRKNITQTRSDYLQDHISSTYVKFSENLTFFTPGYLRVGMYLTDDTTEKVNAPPLILGLFVHTVFLSNFFDTAFLKNYICQILVTFWVESNTWL